MTTRAENTFRVSLMCVCVLTGEVSTQNKMILQTKIYIFKVI